MPAEGALTTLKITDFGFGRITEKKQADLSARLFARILINSYGFASPGPFGLNGSQFMIAGWI